MRTPKWKTTGALAVVALARAGAAQTAWALARAGGVLAALAFVSAGAAQTARPAPDSIEGHLAAGKNAAGGRDNSADFYGLVTALCVAPLNAPVRADAPAPRMNP